MVTALLQLVADGDGRYGSEKEDTGRVDIDGDAVRRLENTDESSVEDLRDAVATDGRVAWRHLDEAEVEPLRSVRRPVQNGDRHAAGRKDRLHPDRDMSPLNNTISTATSVNIIIIIYLP